MADTVTAHLHGEQPSFCRPSAQLAPQRRYLHLQPQLVHQQQHQRPPQRAREEALRVASERQRQKETLRVAAEERERRRVAEQALRVAAEGAGWLPPPSLAAPPATGRAAPRWPMEIVDSRFEKERCARAICCDECGEWYRGNTVGAFWHTRGMPAAEFRRAAWERGEWDASWYCIECCAEYWECSEKEVLEYLGFSKRQSQKDQFMSARAVSASTGPRNPPTRRRPACITDTRFEKRRDLRTTRCDECGAQKFGNKAGAFCHSHDMPPAGEREAAWECGDWDATWYCTECYMRYYDCSYEAACDMLGFSERDAKKARYAYAKA